ARRRITAFELAVMGTSVPHDRAPLRDAGQARTVHRGAGRRYERTPSSRHDCASRARGVRSGERESGNYLNGGLDLRNAGLRSYWATLRPSTMPALVEPV